ncbi:MAG: hypothetical protein HOI33_00325 [Rhodospirillaceae bacterium]|jgi:hypothetical protein|nr:hypothetical protein [Rhodospirillaceae bacterium]
MPRRFAVRRLTLDRAAQAFPLIQSDFGDLTLEQWLGYVSHLLDVRNGGERGIACVESEQGYIHGLFVFRVLEDLRHGKTLGCEYLVAQDLIESGVVLSKLVDAMERLAAECDCVAIHAFLPPDRKELLGALEKAQHVVEMTGTCKRLIKSGQKQNSDYYTGALS